VLEESGDEETIHPTLSAGECIARYRVISCVHVLDDVEVYKLANGAGHEFALKMLRRRAPEKSRKILEREAIILRLLNGGYSPSLVAKGSFEDRTYLVTTWCTGKDVNDTGGWGMQDLDKEDKEKFKTNCPRLDENENHQYRRAEDKTITYT
jgi:hypothetical protein